MQGELTFHGISRLVEGAVRVESASDDRIVISGEQVFDIRDFAVASPTMLMLRIFPDVRVRLHAEAVRAERLVRDGARTGEADVGCELRRRLIRAEALMRQVLVADDVIAQ